MARKGAWYHAPGQRPFRESMPRAWARGGSTLLSLDGDTMRFARAWWERTGRTMYPKELADHVEVCSAGVSDDQTERCWLDVRERLSEGHGAVGARLP